MGFDGSDVRREGGEWEVVDFVTENGIGFLQSIYYVFRDEAHHQIG